MKNKKGLTLVELMSIIVIIGLLSLIVIPNIKSAINKSKQEAFDSNLAALSKAVSDYVTKTAIRIEKGVTKVVTLDDLINSHYLKTIINQKTKERCDGCVVIFN